MVDLRLPTGPRVLPFLRALAGILTYGDQTPTGVQIRIADALADAFNKHGVPSLVDIEPAEPAEVVDSLDTPEVREMLADTALLMELSEHPVSDEGVARAEKYLGELGITIPQIEVLRDTAEEHLVRLRADLLRNSYYTEETFKGSDVGKLWEYARSKMAYYGVAEDNAIADRWRALEDCADGTWGRGVFDFYKTHGFAFPGEIHGIYEIGAMHDWVHVLTDYGTDPDGEINVFAFIAQTMDDSKGLVQFILTLALFQNASIDAVGGLKVEIARSDALGDEGAPSRLADSLWRGSVCTEDVMGGVDHFALAEEKLEDLRKQWSIVPKRVRSPDAFGREA